MLLYAARPCNTALLCDTSQPVLLLRGAYTVGGSATQSFDTAADSEGAQQVFSMVTLKVLNNHGKRDYTCLYRLRVHAAEATSLI
jgi:Sad1 / UNC-like C-terminal